MRIGIDVDGVAADLHTPWLARLSAAIGRTVTPDDMTQWAFWDDFGVTAELVWSLYTPDIYEVVEPYADVRQALIDIREAGHQVVFVTQSRNDDYYQAKRNWLYRHGLVVGRDEIHAVGRDQAFRFKSKGDPRLKLDWLVDDTVENLDDAALVGVYGVLMTLPHNRRLTSLYRRAKNLTEVATILKYAEKPETTPLDDIVGSYNYGAEHCALIGGPGGRSCVIDGSPMVTISAASPEPASPLPTDAEERKGVPLMTGLFDYFSGALSEVAKISVGGNKQHFKPGTPLHWDRTKSTDHADSAVRHLVDRGKLDTDGRRHSAKAAWRALANLQEELEAEGLVPPSRASVFTAKA